MNRLVSAFLKVDFESINKLNMLDELSKEERLTLDCLLASLPPTSIECSFKVNFEEESLEINSINDDLLIKNSGLVLINNYVTSPQKKEN